MFLEGKCWTFYNRETGKIQPDIWQELREGLWRTFDVDNFVYNESLPSSGARRHEYKPIFRQFEPIFEGFYWDYTRGCMAEERFYPPICSHTTYDTFMEVARAYFRRYEGKRIGVHLSGGLDSSLIMALLHHFGIPFVAIGMSSERWEFRTERVVQHRIGALATEMLLLNMDDYGKFDETKHLCLPYPAMLCYHNEGEQAMIDAFVERGVEVVFTGQGGDSVLMDDVPQGAVGEGFNIRNEFCFPIEEEWYAQHGLALVSFFADKDIITQLVNLRRGQGRDMMKTWARQFFKEILPWELSEYDYKADYIGYWVRGLEEMRQYIRPLFQEAYRLLGHSAFNEQAIVALEEANLNALETDDFMAFTACMRVAIWLRALQREGIITA